MHEIEVPHVPLGPYADVFGPERTGRLEAAVGELCGRLGGHTVWNVNSTAAGGGVAELLHAVLPLARTLGLDVRWLVVDGDEEFFAITKRLCSNLYGVAGDGGALGAAEQAHYRDVLSAEAGELARFVAPGDVVIVHEAHPGGLVEAIQALGAVAVWRRHIGRDHPNAHVEQGWRFLRPFVEPADAIVALTERELPAWARRSYAIRPSIDPCRPKNMELTGEEVTAVLGAAGLLAAGGEPVEVTPPLGPPVRVRTPAIVVQEAPAPADVPLVVQVSRWDELKDMGGVLRAFVDSVGSDPDLDGHLVLAGADVYGVSDDPDAAGIFEECRRRWEQLPDRDRARCHLVCLPMEDLRENAVVVNALQRHARVVVQKSLAEGFGLTATEAQWKGTPLIASAVGGLREQVVHERTGLLADDATDLALVGRYIRRLVLDDDAASRFGEAAKQSVRERFLPDRHLTDWTAVLGELLTLRASAPVGADPAG